MENNYEKKFWTKLDTLIAESEVVLDRPKGTPHPRFPQMIYPVDYGYLSNTVGGDGQELDLWRGTANTGLDAILCSTDSLKKDAELKLLINCTEEEKNIILNFHNCSDLMAAIMIRRS